MADAPYNPLNKRHLGENVADALLERTPAPLDTLASFGGAGIYAIYYVGTHRAYRQISILNRDQKFSLPIYVGKAIPPGARKGEFGLDTDPANALYDRLREHAKSIKDASSTLSLSDFFVRYLIVDDIWIPLGESLLIGKFQPAWNLHLDGFGNHDPGSGRYDQQRSPWDVVHPGRTWAAKCAPNSKSSAKILSEFEARLKDSLKDIAPI